MMIMAASDENMNIIQIRISFKTQTARYNKAMTNSEVFHTSATLNYDNKT